MKPSEGLSTPVVFRNLDYDELSDLEPEHLLHQFTEQGFEEAEFVNDLEPPAFKAMPSLRQMKQELQVCFSSILYTPETQDVFSFTTRKRAESRISYC